MMDPMMIIRISNVKPVYLNALLVSMNMAALNATVEELILLRVVVLRDFMIMKRNSLVKYVLPHVNYAISMDVYHVTQIG
jgi:hypothetical protein